MTSGRIVEKVFAAADLVAMAPGLFTALPWPDWSARVRSFEMDGARADYLDIGPHHLEVPPYRDRPDQPAQMSLTVMVAGSSTGEVDGRPLTLSSKQAALIDGRASMRFQALEPVRAFRIFVDMDRLPQDVLARRDTPFAVLKPTPLVTACVGFISGLLQVGNPVVEPADAVAVSLPLIALQTSLLDEALHAGRARGADAAVEGVQRRRGQISLFIEEHLADRDLTPASIATALGVTTRTVHSAYADSRTTAAADIRERRIARVKALLANREEPPNLAALAARVGLSGDRLARGFQASTGMTVREWWEHNASGAGLATNGQHLTAAGTSASAPVATGL